MGVFDKIKSLFIVEEDAGQNQNPLDAVTTEKATTTQLKAETPTIQTPKPTQVNNTGTITDKRPLGARARLKREPSQPAATKLS